jgi:predicted Zn-dependent peptidase
VLVAFGTGSKYETRETNGISHFLEHMFFKGTKKRPTTLAISSELDKVGGEYNAFTSKEYTGYWVRVESRQVNLAFDVISDMLLNSKFDQKEIDREKGVIIEEVNMYRDNPLMYIEDVFEQCLYGDQPAGWDVIGTKENIQKFNRQDFLDCLHTQYGAQNAVVCLAGMVTKDAITQAEKYFLNFKASEMQEKPAVIEKQEKPQIKLFFKETDQINLSLGVRSLPYGHKDEMIVKMISVILGGSMSSRLFTSLREREGLAYYVKTGNEHYTDTGYLTTQAGVPVSKLDRAIKIILQEYEKICQTLVGKEELNKIKLNIEGRIALQLEATDNIADWYARQAILNVTQKRERGQARQILTPEEFSKQVKAVTAVDIRRVAKMLFQKNNLNLAVIGPVKDEKKLFDLLK